MNFDALKNYSTDHLFILYGEDEAKELMPLLNSYQKEGRNFKVLVLGFANNVIEPETFKKINRLLPTRSSDNRFSYAKIKAKTVTIGIASHVVLTLSGLFHSKFSVYSTNSSLIKDLNLKYSLEGRNDVKCSKLEPIADMLTTMDEKTIENTPYIQLGVCIGNDVECLFVSRLSLEDCIIESESSPEEDKRFIEQQRSQLEYDEACECVIF